MEFPGPGEPVALLVDSGPVDCEFGRDLVVVEIGLTPEEFENTIGIRGVDSGKGQDRTLST